MSGTSMGCPGCYSLHCYCDKQNAVHEFEEFPHRFTAETGGECRAAARKLGWRIDYQRQIFLCPKCNPRKANP